MAEIVDTSNSGKEVPEGANDGWLEVGSGENSYRVKAADYDITDANASGSGTDASGPSFSNYGLNWPYASNGDTDQNTRNVTSITWHNLDKAPWYSIYTYRLTINCTDTYNFTFYDESGDHYGLNVFQAGSHYVEYRSGRPNINKVSGS